MTEVEEVVTVEYRGQVVGPCVVLRRLGPLLRLWVPVRGGLYRLAWVPRWRVLGSSRAGSCECGALSAAHDGCPLE